MIDLPDEVSAVALSHAGDFFAAAVGEKIYLGVISGGGKSKILRGHVGRVIALAFVGRAETLASLAEDGTVRLWNPQDGAFLAALLGGGETGVASEANGHAVLLADGRYSVTGEPAATFWWTARLHRFGPGGVDGFDPRVRALTPEDQVRIPPD
jgi:WD40 repeat protein